MKEKNNLKLQNFYYDPIGDVLFKYRKFKESLEMKLFSSSDYQNLERTKENDVLILLIFLKFILK